jgi:hypothetical protein
MTNLSDLQHRGSEERSAASTVPPWRFGRNRGLWSLRQNSGLHGHLGVITVLSGDLSSLSDISQFISDPSVTSIAMPHFEFRRMLLHQSTCTACTTCLDLQSRTHGSIKVGFSDPSTWRLSQGRRANWH